MQLSTFGIYLLVRTGSADHNMWLAGYAISKEMRIRYSEGLLKEGRIHLNSTEDPVSAAFKQFLTSFCA